MCGRGAAKPAALAFPRQSIAEMAACQRPRQTPTELHFAERGAMCCSASTTPPMHIKGGTSVGGTDLQRGVKQNWQACGSTGYTSPPTTLGRIEENCKIYHKAAEPEVLCLATPVSQKDQRIRRARQSKTISSAGRELAAAVDFIHMLTWTCPARWAASFRHAAGATWPSQGATLGTVAVRV